MAGAFPDSPSRRMAYDADGSVSLESGVTEAEPSPGGHGSDPYVAANGVNGNDETQTDFADHNVPGTANGYLICCVIFPEPRELDGMYVQIANFEGGHWVYYSTNTTNGIDGSWTTTGVTMLTDVGLAEYRNNITSLAFPGVRAIKTLQGVTGTAGTTRMRRLHLYGTISPGETPDRILFLDTLNADAVFTKVLDFGDVPRGQTQTRTFKIKNNSSSLTINTIQVTAEDLFLNAGDWYTFGDDGVNYQATFSVGNLGPGATKLLHLKQVIPSGETLSVQAGRIKVSHASVT